MGHTVGKDIYRNLGKKVDSLTMRAPWNEAFYSILKELYTEDEAEVVAKMPYVLSDIDKISKYTKKDKTELRKILDSLSSKGLVMDLWLRNDYRYMPSPLVVGIFEYTMMRTGENLNSKKWAELFHSYLHGDDSFYKANFSGGQVTSPMRTLPHGETVNEADFVEILDYEKAEAIIDSAKSFSIGLCSCRHEKLHVGEKKCDVPLESCTSFGRAADYLVRHKFAREASKPEMLDLLARSKEMKLVLNADNVKKNISFICHCCDCCCNVLQGISKFGYPNVIVTSNYIAESDTESCAGCGNCAEACPINAIKMTEADEPDINRELCLGCGVCALDCSTGAMELKKRKQRVLHPENTFERVILQSLDRGTLQNLLFNNPQGITGKFMQGFVGGFLRIPPVKRAFMSDNLRSRFLSAIKKMA